MSTKKYIVIKHQRGPKLKLIFSVTRYPYDNSDIETEPFMCHDNLAVVKMKFKTSGSSLEIYMKMKRHEPAYRSSHPVKLICKENEGEFYCSDEWLEVPITTNLGHSSFQIGGNPVSTFMFEVNIEVQSIPTTVKTPTPNAPLVNNQLFEDEEFTDFELQGTDGNVPVHKSILLAHSDMVKTMLRGGKWEENKNSCMKIDGATVETLRHLKAYMYLGILPEEGLEPLLLIASCYLMDQLRTHCIEKVVSIVKPEDIESLVEFACANNMPDLVTKIISNCLETVKPAPVFGFHPNSLG